MHIFTSYLTNCQNLYMLYCEYLVILSLALLTITNYQLLMARETSVETDAITVACVKQTKFGAKRQQPLLGVFEWTRRNHQFVIYLLVFSQEVQCSKNVVFVDKKKRGGGSFCRMREIEGEGGTWATRFYNYIIFFNNVFPVYTF